MKRGMHSDAAPAKLLAHLAAAEVGTRLARDEVATLCGIQATSVSSTLKGALDRGELAFTTEGQTRYYHLPIEEEAVINDGPLNITTDSAGDLWFTGATINPEENSCLLTQKQLQQLVQFATRPTVTRLLPEGGVTIVNYLPLPIGKVDERRDANGDRVLVIQPGVEAGRNGVVLP
jgi:hypothetical protein